MKRSGIYSATDFLNPCPRRDGRGKAFLQSAATGIGRVFKREAEAAAKLIQERPLAWQIEIEPVRRFILDRFPYKMLYIIRAELIVVIAVAHQHRRPDYWVDRIQSQ
jgi:hypothetical protein